MDLKKYCSNQKSLKIKSFGFVKDRHGFLYCKDFRKEKICLSNEYLSKFKHGDFIVFDAQYVLEKDLYIVVYAEIDVTGVRYIMGILRNQNQHYSTDAASLNYVFFIPLRLTKDRRNLENDDVGIVKDEKGEAVKKMLVGMVRKFWVIENSQNDLRVLRESELKLIETLDPDDVSLRILYKPENVEKKSFKLSDKHQSSNKNFKELFYSNVNNENDTESLFSNENFCMVKDASFLQENSLVSDESEAYVSKTNQYNKKASNNRFFLTSLPTPPPPLNNDQAFTTNVSTNWNKNKPVLEKSFETLSIVSDITKSLKESKRNGGLPEKTKEKIQNFGRFLTNKIMQFEAEDEILSKEFQYDVTKLIYDYELRSQLLHVNYQK